VIFSSLEDELEEEAVCEEFDEESPFEEETVEVEESDPLAQETTKKEAAKISNPVARKCFLSIKASETLRYHYRIPQRVKKDKLFSFSNSEKKKTKL